ncbi:MAG: nuclear transport factor 2 family protein [Polyangiales bacterium]
MFTDDVAFRDPFRDTRGIEDFRALFDRLFRQYPEVGFSGFDLTGGGDDFTLTYEMSLRMAVGPTFVTPMASVCRARGGRVAEMRDYYDFSSGIASPVGALSRLYRAAVRALFL